MEMRRERDDAPETMTFDLRLDMVRVILGKICDLCVGLLSTSTLSAAHTYQQLGADSSCFAQHGRYPRRGDNLSKEKET